MNFSQNAELGTSSIQRGLLRIAGSGGGGNKVSNNLCYSPEGNVGSSDQCVMFSSQAGDTTSQIAGNVLSGTWQPIAILGGSPQVTTNWLKEYAEATNGQGDMIGYGNAASPYIAYNIHLIDSDNWSSGR